MKMTFAALACLGLVGFLGGCAGAHKSGECCADGTGACCTAGKDAHGDKECKPADPNAKPVAGAWNTACPIMGEDANGSGVTVAYKGRNVQFCCPGCIGKWDKLSDAEKATTLAKYEVK